MPIDLSMATNADKDTKKQGVASSLMSVNYDAKFFDKKLTGNGKTRGVLIEAQNPKNKQDPQTTSLANYRHRSYHNGETTITRVPVDPIVYQIMDYMDEAKRPNNFNSEWIAKDASGDVDIRISMPVYAIELAETPSKTGSTIRQLNICYKLMVWMVGDDSNRMHKNANYIQNLRPKKGENLYQMDMIYNPITSLNNLANDLTNLGYTVDNDAIVNFIDNYSLYDAMCRRSERWNTKIDHDVIQAIKNIHNYAVAHSDNHVYRQGIAMFSLLEDYDVPLDLYKNIYDEMKKILPKEQLKMYCKYNLKLLLSDTMESLRKHKSHLAKVVKTATSQIIGNPSPEQEKAITSEEPLVLVQAGAGTGKSTTVKGRLHYMTTSGVNPNEITVLSFTNAAADHIKELNPKIHSMTIASMINEIYMNNFSHELSSVDTIINSLDIYYNINDQVAMDFKKLLFKIRDNDNDGYTALNAFIEDNYDEIINILNTINQTSLELEVIICYQKIQTLTEPSSVSAKYLIIDEVQDNNIFEFVYTLKYVDKHRGNMFIVGDCSQTLYEFRGSNPKALNVMEGSGVFATYALKTNYRSNQDILTFANIGLSDIEANQYAHIQLQANSLTPVTEQSFTEHVKFHYERLNKQSDLMDRIGTMVAVDLHDYIEEKLNNGESIAFLAYTRKIVGHIKESLRTLYPDKVIGDMIPDKGFNSTIMSRFIKRFWDEIQFVPTTNFVATVNQAIIDKLNYLMPYKADKLRPVIQKMLSNYRAENENIIMNWQCQVINGTMTQDDFLTNVKAKMLEYEIKNNAIRQRLTSAKNEATKQQNAMQHSDFILSTIHSAKGLEFDNVVVIYKNNNQMDEDKKRMYYVAFTRAMKSEFIIAYDTCASPKIKGDYDYIIKKLKAKAPKTQAQQTVNVIKTQGSILDADGNEELKAKLCGDANVENDGVEIVSTSANDATSQDDVNSQNDDASADNKQAS